LIRCHHSSSCLPVFASFLYCHPASRAQCPRVIPFACAVAARAVLPFPSPPQSSHTGQRGLVSRRRDVPTLIPCRHQSSSIFLPIIQLVDLIRIAHTDRRSDRPPIMLVLTSPPHSSPPPFLTSPPILHHHHSSRPFFAPILHHPSSTPLLPVVSWPSPLFAARAVLPSLSPPQSRRTSSVGWF